MVIRAVLQFALFLTLAGCASQSIEELNKIGASEEINRHDPQANARNERLWRKDDSWLCDKPGDLAPGISSIRG
jgi:hypothetical protein